MFDNPIFFLILISVISAVSEWIGKRRKAKRMREEEEQSGGIEPVFQGTEEEAVAERPQSPSQQKQAWEERLRRMLEGENASEEIRPAQSAPTHPSPGTRVEPTILEVDETYFEPVLPEIPIQPAPVSPPVSQAVGRTNKNRVSQTKASAPQTKRTHRPGRSTMANLRSKNAIRQAIIASVVFGAPKGVGEESDLIKL